MTYNYAMANNEEMKFTEWVNEQRGRSLAIAQAVGVTPPVVSDWVTGKKGIPLERCTAIERATGGAVTRKDLRPDDWQDHWPELAPSLSNIALPATETVAQPVIETIAPPVSPIQDADADLHTGVQRRQGSRYETFSISKGV